MKKAALVVTALGFAASAMAGDGVLYDNGAPDFNNGNEMTQWAYRAFIRPSSDQC